MTVGRILLLTGVPGIGKTTVIRRVAQRLAPQVPGGFYTEEIREGGARRGFRLVGFDGTVRVLAHVDLPGPPRVSKYGVDVAVLDRLAETLLVPHPALSVYLVDEIGKMECFSQRFIVAMRGLLDSDRRVVATVARHGSGFIAEVKRRPGIELWDVTHANREAMPARVLAWLAACD